MSSITPRQVDLSSPENARADLRDIASQAGKEVILRAVERKAVALQIQSREIQKQMDTLKQLDKKVTKLDKEIVQLRARRAQGKKVDEGKLVNLEQDQRVYAHARKTRAHEMMQLKKEFTHEQHKLANLRKGLEGNQMGNIKPLKKLNAIESKIHKQLNPLFASGDWKGKELKKMEKALHKYTPGKVGLDRNEVEHFYATLQRWQAKGKISPDHLARVEAVKSRIDNFLKR